MKRDGSKALLVKHGWMIHQSLLNHLSAVATRPQPDGRETSTARVCCTEEKPSSAPIGHFWTRCLSLCIRGARWLLLKMMTTNKKRLPDDDICRQYAESARPRVKKTQKRRLHMQKMAALVIILLYHPLKGAQTCTTRSTTLSTTKLLSLSRR